MATNDLKPKGGRGKKANYRTVQVRCPEPIKEAVSKMIAHWHETGDTWELELKFQMALNASLKENIKKLETRTDDLLFEDGKQIIQLKQLNENLNTSIDELKKQNQELDSEKLELQEKIEKLTLEFNTLKSELGSCEENPNTGISTDAIMILKNALTLKANAGGKIKDAIREALDLLQ